MNYKRKKPRDQVRCTMCTEGRWNIGGDRQQRKRDAQRVIYEEEDAADEEYRLETARAVGNCPDCQPPGSGLCPDCPDGMCVLCGGTGNYNMRA